MKKILFSLTLISAALSGVGQTPCTTMFFSEYVEGSGNNKGMEIYNPTASSINMNNFRYVRYSNGSLSSTDSTDLVGTINAYGTFLIVNGQTVASGTTSPAVDPSLYAMATPPTGMTDHAYPAPTYANGDDALVLIQKSPYKILDIFGKIGEDPGTAWTNVSPFTGAGAWITADHTLRRKSSVNMGVMTNPNLFDALAQYDSLPRNTYSGLNSHACVCSVGIKENNFSAQLSVYPNPLTGNDLIIESARLAIKAVEISNLLGQTIYTVTNLTDDKFIRIKKEEFLAGVYFISITSENNTVVTRKIIVK